MVVWILDTGGEDMCVCVCVGVRCLGHRRVVRHKLENTNINDKLAGLV